MYKQQTFSIRQTAKLTQFPGGELAFFKWLVEHKYLMAKTYEPYQRYRDLNWFIYTGKKLYKTNPLMVVPVARVTVEGLAGLKKAVLKHFPLCPPCQENPLTNVKKDI